MGCLMGGGGLCKGGRRRGARTSRRVLSTETPCGPGHCLVIFKGKLALSFKETRLCAKAIHPHLKGCTIRASPAPIEVN